MKKDIHPKMFETVFKCACGNQEKIFATKPLIEVEICHRCHPVFIGSEEKRAAVGQIEKFRRRAAKKKTA